MAQMVKNLSAMKETWVQSLCWEEREWEMEKGKGKGRQREKGMATHSSVLAWRVPWTEEPGRL